MEKRKEIEISLRNLIIKLRSENISYGNIAKTVKLSRSTVQTIIRNYNNSGTIENKALSGTTKRLSRRDVSSMLKKVVKDSKISSRILAEHVPKPSNKIVNPRTRRNILRENGFKSRVVRKKPLISEKNSLLRLEFAQTHIVSG